MENIITEIEEASIPRGGHRNGSAGAKAVTLGPRDILNGSLTIDGDLHIEGTADGEINASGDVDVEASATVRARIDGRNITVRGNVTGNVSNPDTLGNGRTWHCEVRRGAGFIRRFSMAGKIIRP